MNTLLALACLIGASVASSSYDNGAYVYHGKYPGKCSYDGLYYNDEKSFIFCTNGQNYVQNCSPGTRNSAYGKFAYGKSYSHRDFCDVNLVDSGYVAQHAPKYEEPSYEEPKYEPTYDGPSYEEPKYEEPKYEEPKYEEPKYEPSYDGPSYKEPTYDEPKYADGAYTYHGKYSGECSQDGLYYQDEYSFVYCSNSYSYVQPCSPGTRNSAYEKFTYGNEYSYRDFCDVNLVDGGYASHDGYGYEYAKPSYSEEPKYEEPKYEEPKYEEPKYEEPKYEEPKYEEPKKASYEPEYGYTYHGKYPGQCEYDGLYYKDAESFVFCVNGAHYVQPCAPGSRNSAYSKFSYGKTYSERDFCDVNLVDSGYAAKKALYH